MIKDHRIIKMVDIIFGIRLQVVMQPDARLVRY